MWCDLSHANPRGESSPVGPLESWGETLSNQSNVVIITATLFCISTITHDQVIDDLLFSGEGVQVVIDLNLIHDDSADILNF